MLARRNLLAAGGGGGFAPGDDAVTPAEDANWKRRAALLDPLAYEYIHGLSVSHTVPDGQPEAVVGGWFLQSSTGDGRWFRRQVDVRAGPLWVPPGTTIVTHDDTPPSDDTGGNSYMYICKPNGVISGSRYVSDAKGLWHERTNRIEGGGLELRDAYVEVSAGSNTSGTFTFPTDFRYGLIVNASQHDMSWLALLHSSETAALAILNELGDNNQSRFAEGVYVPWDRTVFPKLKALGATGGVNVGHAVVHYIPLFDDLDPVW